MVKNKRSDIATMFCSCVIGMSIWCKISKDSLEQRMRDYGRGNLLVKKAKMMMGDAISDEVTNLVGDGGMGGKFCYDFGLGLLVHAFLYAIDLGINSVSGLQPQHRIFVLYERPGSRIHKRPFCHCLHTEPQMLK